ncbi:MULTISPECIES: hypothetical protein [unclassified Frankia]|uniref:RNA polymerase sigma factor n=1 Tax=unclassified Frankia TaxID=2632575 RepID=UPI002AD3A0B8|nr:MULTISPECIES: hypothetical protein [unclassified Frankia]
MTTEPVDSHHADMDRWLSAAHANLVDDLAAHLDLDAGLRDAMLPAAHTSLVDDLATHLDLDGGLAAILASKTSTSASTGLAAILVSKTRADAAEAAGDDHPSTVFQVAVDPDANVPRRAAPISDNEDLATAGGPRHAADANHLVEVDFAGPDYRAVAESLVGYAYPILHGWLVTGQIVQECARKGVQGIRKLAAGEITLTHEDIEDLVQDTLLLALDRFATAGRAGRGWTPNGGAPLTAYFLGSCIFAFVDVYRSWEGQHLRQDRLDQDRSSREPIASPDPAELITLAETLRESLPPPGKARTVVLLDAAGYTHTEIAQIIGDTSPRVVEGLLRRFRRNVGERPASTGRKIDPPMT